MIHVTGATGNNGGEIIAAPVKRGRTDVRALVRSPDKEAAKVAGRDRRWAISSGQPNIR